MRVLWVSLLAVALWSIDSLGARATQGDINLKVNPPRAQVNLGEYEVSRGQAGSCFEEGFVALKK